MGKVRGVGERVSIVQLQNTTLNSSATLSLDRSKGGRKKHFFAAEIIFGGKKSWAQQSETRQNKLKYSGNSQFCLLERLIQCKEEQIQIQQQECIYELRSHF